MSKIQEMIDRMCPDGVEYKRLSEVSIQLNGMNGVSKKWEEQGNCRFIDYLNVYNNVGGAKYERLQYQYREAESVRRGASLVKL